MSADHRRRGSLLLATPTDNRLPPPPPPPPLPPPPFLRRFKIHTLSQPPIHPPMKIAAALLLARPRPRPPRAFAPAAPAARSATALSAEQSRADFLRAGFAAAATTSAAALVLSPSEASAAKYGPLGRGSPEVVDPKTADVDLDVLSSGAVQKAYRKRQGLPDHRRGDEVPPLTADPQGPTSAPSIRKNLGLRSAQVRLQRRPTPPSTRTARGAPTGSSGPSSRTSPSSRRPTGRSPGCPRSTIRLNTMVGKLDKLSKAFNDFLAFVPAVKERAPPPPSCPGGGGPPPAAAPATE